MHHRTHDLVITVLSCDTIASISAITVTIDSMDVPSLLPVTIAPLCICADRRFPSFSKNYSSDSRRLKRNVIPKDYMTMTFHFFPNLNNFDPLGRSARRTPAHSNEFKIPDRKIFPMGTMIQSIRVPERPELKLQPLFLKFVI